MGRGNVCVNGEYETLYYIDNDDLHVYRYNGDEDVDEDLEVKMYGEVSLEEIQNSIYVYDEIQTELMWNEVEQNLCDGMKKLFPSFTDCDKFEEYHHRRSDAQPLLENNLFYIAVEDNQWSMAVKLLQKEHPYFSLEGLQRKHYQSYKEGLKAVLFTMFDTLGVYGGAWTSGRIHRPAV